MPWYISISLACLFLPVMNCLFSMWKLNIRTFLYFCLITIFVNGFFWYGFHKAPSYIFCYILGGVLSAFITILISYFIKGESLSLTNSIGIVLTIIGLILINIK